MVYQPTIHKINTAVQTCLDRCYRSEMPLACVAEYLDELRSNPAWRLAEVEEVETTVLRMLRAIVNRPRDGRFPARIPHDRTAADSRQLDPQWQQQ